MTRHQYGISALVSQTSFGGEISGSVAKCQLFSQASETVVDSLHCHFLGERLCTRFLYGEKFTFSNVLVL